MPKSELWRRAAGLLVAAAVVVLLVVMLGPGARWVSRLFGGMLASSAFAQIAPSLGGTSYGGGFCDEYPWYCTDYLAYTSDGHKLYNGHDEPSVLFYSSTPGAGNSNTYTLTLPTEPPTAPKQDGTGGTDNIQLFPAFWFGMAMCDPQSAPEFSTTCMPDSNSNIFDNSNPAASDYIGRHPGTAFMELQFYPPNSSSVAIGCSSTRWCAALNIDSLSLDMNNGVANNLSCPFEPINFAFITKSGNSTSPADPLNPNRVLPTSDVFLMNPGDQLKVTMNDTPSGFYVTIQDVTTGQSGSMTASTANGFAQVLFQPTATTCSSQPFAFHPMYSTSSEHTGVPWASDSSNVRVAAEIGHFEYCAAFDANGNCTAVSVGSPDSDDLTCGLFSLLQGVTIGGCEGKDSDFDGVPYQLVWPGTIANASQDQALHPAPVVFTSPLFQPTGGGAMQDFDRVAFETDLPAIESGCNPSTGAGCVNPPPRANFYPFYSISKAGGNCVWQLGGANRPGTTDTFGGEVAEFGSLLQIFLPTFAGPVFGFGDFRQVLSSNPCLAATSSGDTTPPSITITTPANGATYGLKQLVAADYSCTDPDDPVATCAGPVASGSSIDTTTLGAHTFTVMASDSHGNTSSKSVTYTVADMTAPTINIFSPLNGSSYKRKKRVAAMYSCTDPDDAVATCAGPVASGSNFDTRSRGTHTFTVTASDSHGNTSSASVTYTVGRHR